MPPLLIPQMRYTKSIPVIEISMKRNFLEQALDKVIAADLAKEKKIDQQDEERAMKEERETEYAESYQHPSE